MYVWIGIETESQLKTIKEKARKIENEIGFLHSNFTLPLHISLKMSFKVSDENFDAVVSDLLDYFKSVKPFKIETGGIRFEHVICWISMKRNYKLDRLHDYLNDFLKLKYGVPLHEYDTDYKYHTTLFSDSNEEKVLMAYKLIEQKQIPKTINANTILIGCSESGNLGTFKIKHTIKLN